LNSLILKIIRFVDKFKKTVLFLFIVVLISSASTALLINQLEAPYATPSPTITPNQTINPTLTPTVEPTLSPTPTIEPEPTYIPGEKQYYSYGVVYVTDVEIYGGDLLGNQILWGALYVGDSKDVSFYVRSTSNVPIVLSLSVTDWIPTEISSYLKLTWNYDQTQIDPNQTILLTLTLSTSPSLNFINFLVENNINAFNFNVHIYSTKH
jgi:hypothetical protein